MKAGDLNLITRLGEIYPNLLNHFMMIYRMGYKQSVIDSMKGNLNSEVMYGINYGREVVANN